VFLNGEVRSILLRGFVLRVLTIFCASLLGRLLMVMMVVMMMMMDGDGVNLFGLSSLLFHEHKKFFSQGGGVK